MYKIKDKTRCSGCGACMNICSAGAVTMAKDENGELYPYTDEKKCVSCGRCIKVCPYLSGFHSTKAKRFAIGYINDGDVRSASSAGGVAAALSLCVISLGGAVFGSRYDGVFSCVYDRAEDAFSLGALAGRKYVESDIAMSYYKAKELLLLGRKVIFFGTPCKIAAFNNFLGAPFENLITVSVGCNGVVGGYVWQKYMESEGVPEKIDLSSRIDSENSCALVLTYDEKNVRRLVRRDTPIHRAIGAGIGVRPSCFSCTFNKKECGDISLQKYDLCVLDKSVSPARQPMSLIYINTEKGAAALDDASELLTMRELSAGDAQSYFRKRQGKKKQGSMNLNRAFIKKLSSCSFEEALESIQNIGFSVKLCEKIKKIIIK